MGIKEKIKRLVKSREYSDEIALAQVVYERLPEITERLIRMDIYESTNPKTWWNPYDLMVDSCERIRPETSDQHALIYSRIIMAIACAYSKECGKRLDDVVNDYCELKGSERGNEKKVLLKVIKVLNIPQNKNLYALMNLYCMYEAEIDKRCENARKEFMTLPRGTRKQLLIGQKREELADDNLTEEEKEVAVEQFGSELDQLGTRASLFSPIRNRLYLNMAVDEVVKRYPEDFKGVNMGVFYEIASCKPLDSLYKEKKGIEKLGAEENSEK